MSWRSPGGSRESGYRSRNDEGSVFQGGSAGGPPLSMLIGACVLLGVLGLALAFIFGGNRAAQTAAAPQPAAQAQPTVELAQPTAVPAPTEAPAAAAGVPTGPLGPAVAEGEGEALEVESVGDTPFFSVESLQAAAGELYTLTFRNTGQAVQHNWVLVEADAADAVNSAAQEGLQATRNTLAAVPPADTPGLLAASPMIPAGEETTLSFTAPDAGTYLFICTYPGHYTTMRGELVVE